MATGDARHPGALVISLDFELRWGVRDLYPLDGGDYRANLLGSRQAIPRMLDLFAEHGVRATWATVGMLFAADRAALRRHEPAVKPRYADPALDPYRDRIGEDEASDPLHYSASLIDRIRTIPGQEVASHTFGHVYPLEAGVDRASFRADLESAVAIARERGIALRSLVFPRNQFNPAFADVIAAAGFTNCRANAPGWIYKEADAARYFRPDIRAGRLLDAYVPVTGSQVIRWAEIPFAGPLCCLPASHFLRAHSPQLRRLDPLRFRRIAAGIRQAAREGGVYHLWWHPHNAGVHTDAFMGFLRGLLEVYAECRERYGMTSLTMAEAAETAAAVRMLRAV